MFCLLFFYLSVFQDLTVYIFAIFSIGKKRQVNIVSVTHYFDFQQDCVIYVVMQNGDAYVDLNTLGEAINRVKRPMGTRRAPGQHCQHIKLKNPDFVNGRPPSVIA